MAVAAAPAASPAIPPARESRIPSARNWTRTWPLVAPRARRRPISELRSRTEMTTATAPSATTYRASAPRPLLPGPGPRRDAAVVQDGSAALPGAVRPQAADQEPPAESLRT